MDRRWVRGIFCCGVLAACGTVVATGLASDHNDTAQTVTDQKADITDVYAFMRPEGTGPYTPSTHMVVMMTMDPGATTATTLDPGLVYTFRLTRLNAALATSTSYSIVCSARDPKLGPQTVVCGAAGTFGTATLNAAPTGAPTDKIRVWAGMRSDPAFFDKAKFDESVSTKSLKFVNPGTNSFQGKNVMAIVVEFEVAGVLNPADAATTGNNFAVAADITRSF